jgi:hypothetical protein
MSAVESDAGAVHVIRDFFRGDLFGQHVPLSARFTPPPTMPRVMPVLRDGFGGRGDGGSAVHYRLRYGGAGLRGTTAPSLLDQPGAGIRLAAKRTVVGAIYSTPAVRCCGCSRQFLAHRVGSGGRDVGCALAPNMSFT